MVYKTDQMKNFLGWILEAIFLVFVISISYASFDSTGFDEKVTITSSSALVQSDVWRSNQNLDTDADIDLKAPTDWNLHVSSLGLLVIKISDARPFFISLIERSISYFFITTNAP